MTPNTEKLLYIIALALEREEITGYDVAELLGCSYKSGHRLITKLYYMQHEIKFISVVIKFGVTGGAYEKTSIRVRLKSNYVDKDGK